MSLQSKVFAILCAAFVLMIGLHLVIQAWVLIPSFVEAETVEAEADVERCVRAVEREIDHIDRNCHDWAAWDALYDAAPEPDAAFVAANLPVDTLVVNRLSLGQLVSPDGRVTWQQAVDLATKRATRVEGLPSDRYPPGHTLLASLTAQGPIRDRVVRGVLMVGERPLLVASRPIVRTNHEGPPHGVLVLGHFLTADDVRRLGAQTLVDFTVVPATPSRVRAFGPPGAGTGTALITRPTPDRLDASRLYPGIDGAPALVLHARIPRGIMRQGSEALRSAMIVTALSSLVLFGLVMLFLLRRAVLKPLSGLIAHARSIQASGDYSARLHLGRRDEIGVLADTLDQLMSVIDRDIANRTRTEEQLRASDRLNRILTEHTGDLIAVCDAEVGTFTHVSPSFQTVLGHAPESLLGRPWHALVHPDDLPAASARLEAVEDPSLPVSMAYRMLDHEGQYLWFETLVKVVHEPDGTSKQWVFNIQEVTARKRAEEERARLEGQLRQSQKMEAVGRLAGGVAHDFNNLLMGITLSAELLQHRLAKDDKNRDVVGVIQKTAERAAALTGQLLAFSRKQVIAPKVIDLNDLVSRSVAMLRRLIGEDIKLVFEPSAELGPVMVDPTQMEQVLVNLVVNARDAMPGGGRLIISTMNVTIDEPFCTANSEARPGTYVRWSVCDTGTGMTPEIKARLFEPFFTTKEKGKGTGLGLSMVYGIVAQHRGFVTVESEPGVGTTFAIHLPLAAAAPEREATRTPSKPSATGHESILLVEDEEVVRRLARQILEDHGYLVMEAESGEAALALAAPAEVSIDLLLTDVVMPGMNGRQLFEKLLGGRPDLGVLYMSGYTGDVIARHGVLEEGTAFIAKPFTTASLARKVREVLDARRRGLRDPSIPPPPFDGDGGASGPA